MAYDCHSCVCSRRCSLPSPPSPPFPACRQVRPYLLADGGDVQVVSVDGGVVALRLQGSCSTCASSAATMKNGIEKVIMVRPTSSQARLLAGVPRFPAPSSRSPCPALPASQPGGGGV